MLKFVLNVGGVVFLALLMGCSDPQVMVTPFVLKGYQPPHRTETTSSDHAPASKAWEDSAGGDRKLGQEIPSEGGRH